MLLGCEGYHFVLVVDKGFITWPPQVDTTDLVSLEDWCKFRHVLLVSPDHKNKNPDWIFQFDESTGKFIQKPLADITVGMGRSSLILNHIRICTAIRSCIEQLFGALLKVEI